MYELKYIINMLYTSYITNKLFTSLSQLNKGCRVFLMWKLPPKKQNMLMNRTGCVVLITGGLECWERFGGEPEMCVCLVEGKCVAVPPEIRT